MTNLRQQLIADGWKIKYIRDPWFLGQSGDSEITIIYREWFSLSGHRECVDYSYSVCSEKDNFSKDVGVEIAYNKSSYDLSVAINKDPVHAILEDIISKDVKRSLKGDIKQYLINQRTKELDKIIGE